MTEPDSSPTSRLVAEVLGLKKPKNNKRFVGGAKFQKIELKKHTIDWLCSGEL